MPLTPPQTRPDPPFDSVSLPWEKPVCRRCRHAASISSMRYRTWEFSRQLFGNQHYRRGGEAFTMPTNGRRHRFSRGRRPNVERSASPAFPLATDQLSRGRRGWACGGMSRMGRAHAPDGLGRSPTPVLPCAQDSAHMQAATEPPWMGLRRPPRAHRRRPNPGTFAAQGCSPKRMKPGKARPQVIACDQKSEPGRARLYARARCRLSAGPSRCGR
jgi:hypothetical protein